LDVINFSHIGCALLFALLCGNIEEGRDIAQSLQLEAVLLIDYTRNKDIDEVGA
jgi:hypothetical protein